MLQLRTFRDYRQGDRLARERHARTEGDAHRVETRAESVGRGYGKRGRCFWGVRGGQVVGERL
jgi:hypothetical protein